MCLPVPTKAKEIGNTVASPSSLPVILSDSSINANCGYTWRQCTINMIRTCASVTAIAGEDIYEKKWNFLGNDFYHFPNAVFQVLCKI